MQYHVQVALRGLGVEKGTSVTKSSPKAKATIKKVASKLKKASQAHAGQAKTLDAIKLKKGGSTVNKAVSYTHLRAPRPY